jgi:hypothetical protein
MEDIKKIQEFFSKPLEEGKQLDQVDFAKVVKAVEQTGHPVTVLLVPKFNEIEVLTGMDAPDDILFDLSNAVDSLGYGRNDIIIAGDSSNLSRREYSDIRRVNGGAKDYFEEAIAENDSYARVSKPRFIKDKNNPNFLNVILDYDIGPGGNSIAFGKETMSGQIRRLSSEKARKIAHDIALDLEANFNLEDIEVTDLKNGKVRIFAVSDDFIDMDPNMLSEATKDEETEFHKKLDTLVHDTFGKRKGELEEAYVPSNIAEFAKRRGVSSLVRKVAGWAEKVGARITGGTAIGKGYNTLILDMGYQTADIRIDVEDETIELYDEPIYSFNDFKRVFMEEESRKQAEHDEETLRKERGLEEALAEASKGAMNYFNDLKYYYQKAFRYLDIEEREEYKQLAKDFFSKLQVDNKVRAVGLDEYNTGIYYKDEKTQDKTKEASKSALEKVKDMIQKVLKEEEGYSKFLKTDDNPEGKTKGLDTATMNKILMNVIKDIEETKRLGEGMIEEELCPKGKAYIKKRQAAGEKSSAYLSGRAVKVCKGQMKG